MASEKLKTKKAKIRRIHLHIIEIDKFLMKNKRLNFMSSDIPLGKINRWCERKGLYTSDKNKLNQANNILRNKELTRNEQAFHFIHELFNCEGIEFVVFSSARFDKKVALMSDIKLVPCFLPTQQMKSWNDPLVRLTFNMQNHARFIYDGWVPITDWRIETVRNAIKEIDRTFSLFAAQERIWFTWEPKYYPSQVNPSSHKVTDNHILEIFLLGEKIHNWNEKDKTAFYRSLAWISQSLILPQPAARFFFCILSIESLATYIEKEATNDSVFSGLITTYPNSTQDKVKCIDKTIKELYSDNPIQAINNSYFNCVIPITRMLKKHLSMIFADESEYYDLMFTTDEDKSLFGLRHKIAHGGFDALNDFDRQKIADRVWDAERTARKYFHIVLQKVLGKASFTEKMIKSVVYPFIIGSHEGMYKGPIHMAEYYTYIKR